eukprot:m.58930 g.58930  ORF g.58930 m.58930 type:complete len:52 (+) comp9435_c1_seq1:36-191(+)
MVKKESSTHHPEPRSCNTLPRTGTSASIDNKTCYPPIYSEGICADMSDVSR